MFRFSTDFRVFILGVLMILGLSGIMCRLWVLQVMRGEAYTAKIGSNTKVTVRIPSVRGEIRDRNGIPLVQNRASYNVDFYLPDMVRGYRQRRGALPKVIERTTVAGMAKDVPVNDVIKIVNSGVIPRLQQLDLVRDYNAKHLKTHYEHDTLVPFTYIEDIDFPTMARFSEHDVGLPGVEISVKPVRQYLYGALAAHILGYVGMPRDIQQEPDVKEFNFYQPDVDGKNQIELAMDKYLRGDPGVRVMQRNAKGVIDSEVKVVPPKPGSNVYLTIDAKIQYITEMALRHPTLGRAAAVVLDPNNGDILSIASIPSFDPNVFIPSITLKDWNSLLKDPAVPLVNRAVSGFPPGSTFKIVTALAGLMKGLGHMHYNCSGATDYGGRPFHCWIAEKHGSHGTLGLADALKVSCDCFFYQYGNAADIDAIDHIGEVLGLGHRYDIGLTDEKEGCMPGRQWMAARYPNQKWTQAYTANVSIGQGYVLASPLQMAVAYATVANGGIAYEPRLVRTILRPDGKPALDEDGAVAVPDQPKIRADLRKVVSADQIEVVRHGLWEVVNETGGPGGSGTGAKGRMKDVVVAGKTGSAQASDRGKRETIAWFCCFAPYDHPKYVVAVMIQGGLHGGSVAGPVAAHILQQCLALEKGTLKVALQPLRPAHNDHPFEAIETLADYKDSANSGIVSDDDEAANGDESATEKTVQMDHGERKPDIRPEADDQGRVRKRKTQSRDNDVPKPKPAVRRAQPAVEQSEPAEPRDREPAEQPRHNIFERFFHPNRKPNQTLAPSGSGRG